MDRQENIPILNNDICFHILKFLPANYLHYHGRFVCNVWANIIRDPSFINSHLLLSNPGIVMQANAELWHACFFDKIQGNLRMKRLAPVFEGVVTESCDGVMLLCDRFYKCKNIRLLNPVTMQEVHLPVLPNPHDSNKLSIGRVRCTGRFKVVCTVGSMEVSYHWLVLTVGEDTSWRRVDITIDKDIKESDINDGPQSVGEIIFWGLGKKESTPGISIYALDLRDETTHKICVPDRDLGVTVLDGALFRNKIVHDVGNDYMELELLNDFHQGEWVKVMRFRTGEIWHEFFSPVVGLLNLQVLIFLAQPRPEDLYQLVFIAYNVKTGERSTIASGVRVAFPIVVHCNSLVSL